MPREEDGGLGEEARGRLAAGSAEERAEADDLALRVDGDHVVDVRIHHLLAEDRAAVLPRRVRHLGAAELLEQRGDGLEVIAARSADAGVARRVGHRRTIFPHSARSNRVGRANGSGTVP